MNIVINVKVETICDQLFMSSVTNFDLLELINSFGMTEPLDEYDKTFGEPAENLRLNIFIYQLEMFEKINPIIFSILRSSSKHFIEFIITKELEEFNKEMVNLESQPNAFELIKAKIDSHNRSFLKTNDEYHSMSNVKPTLKIITWNIMAHQATHWYNKEYHGSDIGDRNETEQQKNQRHSLALQKLLREDADVILFQEIDYDFYLKFKIELWKKYDIVFNVFTNKDYYDNGVGAFGTGIAFKKSKFENQIMYEYISSPSYETYAGKNALLLTLTMITTKISITFVSVHLTGKEGPYSNNLLRNVTKKILNLDNVIIGGDFNCNFLKKEKKCGYSISKKFHTIDNTSDTTLTFDFGEEKYSSAVIDKMYFTNLFTIFEYRIPLPILNETGKFDLYNSSGIVINASDHLYIVATVQLG